MPNNFNFHNNYNLSKDLIKSIMIHGILGLIILILSFADNLWDRNSSKMMTISSNGNRKTHQTAIGKIDNNLIAPKPIHASLIDHKSIQQAISRQTNEAKQQVLQQKKLQQQEQQLTQLKKLAAQEALKLKQESENIKKITEKNKQEQEQIKKQQQILQQTAEQLKQQAKKLDLKKEKLAKLESKQLDEKKNSQLIVANQEKTQKIDDNLQASSSNLSGINTLNQTQNNSMRYQGLGAEEMQIVIKNELQVYQSKWKADIINNRKKVNLLPANLMCKIRIKLRPDGKLALVRIEKSSGNLVYDSFSEQAVYRSEPFEMPTDPVLNKEFTEFDHLLEFDDNAFNDV